MLFEVMVFAKLISVVFVTQKIQKRETFCFKIEFI